MPIKSSPVKAAVLTREAFSKFTGIVTSGSTFTAILKDDGTVQKTTISNGPSDFKIEGWQDVKAIAAGDYHIVGLKKDGTVVAAGDNRYGQLNVEGWSDIVSVSAGFGHTIGLKSDGTVVAVGYNNDKACDVGEWKDIVAVSANGNTTVGLKSDGTLVGTGPNYFDELNFSTWNDIVSVSAGGSHTVGLKSDGTVVATGYIGDNRLKVEGWQNIVAIAATSATTVGLKNDGTVVATGSTVDGKCNVGAWSNIVAISASGYNTIGLKSDGALVGVGYGSWGALNIQNWKVASQLLTFSINENIIKPSEAISIQVNKGSYSKFFELPNTPQISLSGGAVLSNTPMQASENGYEFTYTAGPEDGGLVNVQVDGMTDIFGNNIASKASFKIIPLISAMSTIYNVKPGDNLTMIVSFSKPVKRDLKVSLTGAVELTAVSPVEVSGSYGRSYSLSYNAPNDSVTGAVDLSLYNVTLYDGTVFDAYTEKNIFVKENVVLPIKSLTASKSLGILGEVIDLEAEFNEPIQPGLQIQFSGGSSEKADMVEVPGSNGTKYKYNFNVDNGENGAVSLSIINAHDSHGNLCAQYILENMFSVDGIVPIASVTASLTAAKLNDIVRIKCTTSEAATGNIQIRLSCGTKLWESTMVEAPGTEGKEYYYDYKVGEGDEGKLSVYISNISDLAGNTTAVNSTDLLTVDGNVPKLNFLSLDSSRVEAGQFMHIVANFSEPVRDGVIIKLTDATVNKEFTMSEVAGSSKTQYETFYEMGSERSSFCVIGLDNIVDCAGNNISLTRKAIAIIDYDLPDVNKDDAIDILDLACAAKAYNSKLNEENYNQDFDQNKDNRIDIFDLVLISKNIHKLETNKINTTSKNFRT
jgi:hypothetical protein